MLAPKHVDCNDCHNPHAVLNRSEVAPLISGALAGVSGVTSGGTLTSQAQYEYEICFKCHGDNLSRVESNITRQITQTNTRLEFAPSSVSYHPVEAVGRNSDVPSLLPPRQTSDLIYCSDCHGSSLSKKAQGSGPDGPHGSNYSPLLLADYRTADNTSESSSAYALCYRCHSRSLILSESGPFKYHKKHVEEKRTPCSACHDAHGISSSQGTTLNNSHLINFDTTIVQPDPQTGRLAYESLGSRQGQCFLRCHNKTHSPLSYSGAND